MSVVDVTRPLDAETDAPPRLDHALGRERLISRRLLIADATALVVALLIVGTLAGDTIGTGRGRLALVSLFSLPFASQAQGCAGYIVASQFAWDTQPLTKSEPWWCS